MIQAKDFSAVILAGGSGERFWPLSTPEHPKQFLRVFGGESLIRQSVSRLAGLVTPEHIYVITSQALVPATRRELPELPPKNIVGEPMRRDTGAAIALATGLCKKGMMGVFSSDQMVSRPERFRTTVRKAIQKASHKPIIMTIGVKPTFPSTGFGYIQPSTGRFVEKPTEDKAREYVNAGYLWNAGLFVGQVETFRSAFATHAPELKVLTEKTFTPARLKKVYEALPKISFDFAVMEKLPKVGVVEGNFGWDDVGSYGAFDRYFPHDRAGNVREGPVTVVESSDNICVARSARISLLGVKNLVVVTTPDAVLVADKARVTELKKLFKK